MSPGAAVPAAGPIASAATSPGGKLSTQQAWYLGNDLVVADDAASTALQPLPVADDSVAPVWADATNPTTHWYAPRFDLLRPTPNTDPEIAEFAFLLRHTPPVMGPAGLAPGLAATLRFTLRPTVPDAAIAAAGGATLRQVPLGGLGVALELP
jgi:hypothetical protein